MGFEALSQGVYVYEERKKEKKCVCVHARRRACVFFKYDCSCASMCQSVCGSGGNRWEVCHVLVNKSVIVLFCPA